MKKKVEVLFRNPHLEKKREYGRRLHAAFELLSTKGIEMEAIAADLKVSYHAVYTWFRQIKVPKYATLVYLENKYKRYGVKIL